MLNDSEVMVFHGVCFPGSTFLYTRTVFSTILSAVKRSRIARLAAAARRCACPSTPAPSGCRYHYSHALDIFRPTPDGGTKVVPATDSLDPLQLYRLDHGDPPFMRQATPPGRT